MPDLPIIDTHVHLWVTNKLNYPWIDNIPALKRPFLLEDYKSATGFLQVEAVVFMQCEADPSQAMEEAKWVISLAQDYPRIKAIIPRVPVEKGEETRPFLEELRASPLVKGVRRLIQSEPNPQFCLQPDFVKGVQLLADYNLSFDICVSHIQMANTIEMVRQCQHVTFILDHIGKPDIKNHLLEPWGAELKMLSELANVSCKISGMVTEADHENWTKEDLKPYIEHVISCFGFDRVMFGGDWPVVTMAGKYLDWVEALDWALSGCSSDELQKLFHDNAMRIYRIG